MCALWDGTIAAVEALESGAKVADMEVVRLLGKGAFGHVYAVNAPGHDGLRALKIMNLDVSSESMQLRFQREAEVIQRLQSKFVPAIYDFGKLQDESPFILMELLEGQTLGQLLAAEGGTLSWRRVLALGVQVCEALEVAHSVGVLHRDLKPDNLFIVGTGAEEQVKILDFGVATFVSGHTDRHGALTQTSAIVGTPHYMSPEQIRSTTVGVEADIYMLGVVLYECLTGHRPFDGENLGDLLGNVLGGQYRPIAYHASQTPRIITNAVQRAMSIDPNHRFPSALAFKKALSQGRAAISELPPKPTIAPRRVDPEKATMAATGANDIAPSTSSPTISSPPISLPSRKLGLFVAAAVVLVTLTSATTYIIATRQSEETAPAPIVHPTQPAEVRPEEEAETAEESPEIPLGVTAPTPEEPQPPVVRPPRNRTSMRVEVEPSLEVEPPPTERAPLVRPPPDGLINPFE